jgi:HlyD family secretion protein
VTSAELTARQNAVRVAERALDAAKNRLASLSEVRESDVEVARADLDAALADENRARVALADSLVYSPVSGRVLRVNTKAGEQSGPQGLVTLAETGRMYAVAEVYEADIRRVRVGQKATISGSLLSQSLAGVVETVGHEVTHLSALPDDPMQFTDGRVFRVRIRLNEPDRVAGLINARVSIRIEP